MAKAKPAKSAARKTTKKADKVFYVLSERTKLFVWRPIELYAKEADAVDARKRREEASPYSINGYKVDRVVLI